MSHQLDERIRDHAGALDQAAPPIRLDDVRVVSGRGDTGRRLARPLAAAAAVVVVVVGLVVIGEVRGPEPEPAAVSPPLPNTTATATELSESDALDGARIRWADAAVAGYQLTVAEDRNSWSRGCRWTTVVLGGDVTESTVDASPTAQECPQAEWTVEQLHDLIADWLASIEEFPSTEFGEHQLQVEYDQVGVPVSMEYDLANSDDEEASMRVTFETLSAEPASSAWSAIAADPRGPTSQPGAVWTGSEAVVIGGLDPDREPRTGAVAYAPATDSWRTLADPPASGVEPLVVWTGTEVLMIGGRQPDSSEIHSDAHAYDLAADRWSTIAAPPPGSVTARSPWVWTGTNLLVWPAVDDDPSIVPASYDPQLDSWTELPAAPIPPRHSGASVWTGTEWIIWGGTDGTTELNDGAAYNTTSNSWRTLATSDLAPRRVNAIWTGNEMIVSAGSSGGDRETGNGELALADGAAYDPATDTWRPITPGPAHPGFLPIWTGTDLVMFAKGNAVVYNVARDEWTDTCCTNTGSEGGGTPLWTGANILLIGSYSDENGGATFQPQPAAGAQPQAGGESMAPEMSVDGPLVVGAEFEVSFTGRLRESRGGFFWLQEPDGTQLALLRSDGKTDIPMGYDLDVANASMVDDALSGDSSTLILPPQIAPGPYRLCTANTAPPDVCIDVELLGG